MAHAPTPGRVHDAGADEATVTLSLDGVQHVLYPNLLTAQDLGAVRGQVGMSLRKLIECAQDDPDLDIIAALIWVARCQGGESVTFDEVAAGITYQSKLDVAESSEPVSADHPLD